MTYILHDCLGGDSKALMFCNISCDKSDALESLNTLQFASRVRSVELGEAKKSTKQLELLRSKTLKLKHEMDLRMTDIENLKTGLYFDKGKKKNKNDFFIFNVFGAFFLDSIRFFVFQKNKNGHTFAMQHTKH